MEKKACPMALKTTLVVIFEKSGFSRKFSPSLAPGMEKAQITRTQMMNSNSGIITLENFSIPSVTPRIITTWVSSMKRMT